MFDLAAGIQNRHECRVALTLKVDAGKFWCRWKVKIGRRLQQ